MKVLLLSEQCYRSYYYLFVTSSDLDILAANQSCGDKTKGQVGITLVFDFTSLLEL